MSEGAFAVPSYPPPNSVAQHAPEAFLHGQQLPQEEEPQEPPRAGRRRRVVEEPVVETPVEEVVEDVVEEVQPATPEAEEAE